MRDFHQPRRSTVHAANGMCASSHPLASAAAIDILRRGGNAADAAIAAALICGLGEPAMTGLGGDMFALVKPAGSDTVWGLNGSGHAPKALTADRLRAEGHDIVPRITSYNVCYTKLLRVKVFAGMFFKFDTLSLNSK